MRSEDGDLTCIRFYVGQAEDAETLRERGREEERI